MHHGNRKYVLVLAISLGASLLYITSNYQNEEPVNMAVVEDRTMGIENEIQSIPPNEKLVSNPVPIDATCETDQFFGDKIIGIFWKKREYLENRRACILKYCGDVCNTKEKYDRHDDEKEVDDNITQKVGELQPGNYANLKPEQKHIDCKLLFQSKVHDLPASKYMTKPFHYIPDSLLSDYTYDGRIKIHEWYIEENFPTKQKDNYYAYRDDQWTEDVIDNRIQAVLKKDWEGVGGAYELDETRVLYETINLYKDMVIGKNALVVGSETPWIEAILLAVGAKHVTTMEYNRIVSSHPQIEAVLPSELSNRFISNGYKSLFDTIVSYSSIEHSGLTRYGDAPHPWGDLVAMARNWCFMQDGGLAFIGVPTYQKDLIEFNAHRVYGPLLLSHLFTNWKLKFASWPFVGPVKQKTWQPQKVFVLEKDKNV